MTSLTAQGLANTAACFAALPALFGAAVYASPQAALNSLDIPTPGDEQERKVLYSIFRLSAAREMAYGVTTLGIWLFAASRRQGYAALGIAMLAKGCMKLSDGFVTKSMLGKGQWQHWVFVPFNFGIGAALLGLIPLE